MKEQEKKNSSFLTTVTTVWRGIDFFRRLVLNIVFFAIFFYLLNLLACQGPTVPGSTVLVLAPQGNIVEELSPGKIDPVNKLMGTEEQETLLKDLLDAIDSGKDDPRVKVLLLNLNALGNAWLTKLQDLGAAINRFKKSGKKVIATADDYSRNSYYLAAHADEIYIHHMGLVVMEGYSRYRQYYKEGLDKLEVDLNLFRVGKYKSAPEPYIRNNMSKDAKEANMRWLNALWDSYLKDIARARKINIEKINDYIDRFNEYLKESNGQAAIMAKNAGLVDYVASRDLLRQRLIKIVGEDKETHSFYQIGYKDYLAALDYDRWGDDESGDVIGIIVAKGSILNGHQPPGTIGGDSTAALIREARKDDDVKAILFRVDSGGGSAFASEVIRRELELARKDGKPVVVSMGSVAASGGYWISMASDQVWAYPTTITGSIGIFGFIPTFQKTLKKYLGIQVDGVGTNKFAGALRVDREMSTEVKEALQTLINRGYDQFITMVAKARNKTPDQVHEIAQGRVWIGSDAHKLGLVDHMGGMGDALDSAAKLAKLEKPYKIKYFRKKPGFWQRLWNQLFAKASVKEQTQIQSQQPLNPFTNMMQILVKQMKRFSEFNDPHGVYAYWLYDIDL
ncbi:MAG: signal peptide peptidase SppA [Candidatus Aminicenantes bacterium]|nr:MAG: signal peptide peptidase SppA [Candidatus Aminicenantes bacterium]